MKTLLFLVIIMQSFFSFSQNENDLKSYYKWFDEIISIENTNLLNGISFKEHFKTLASNNQYLISKQFKNGNLIYHSQPYFNIPLKYDVYSDEIILSSIDGNEYFAIQLAKNNIDSFTINNQYFINSNELNVKTNHTNNAGFYEVVIANKIISLYKKHKKEKREKRNSEVAYTEFKHKKEYILFYDKEIHEFSSKKSLLKLFPNLKKRINSFYINNKTFMKYDYNKFLIKLMTELNLNLKSKD